MHVVKEGERLVGRELLVTKPDLKTLPAPGLLVRICYNVGKNKNQRQTCLQQMEDRFYSLEFC